MSQARDLGIEPGVFPPGPLNAITDVDGVKVGHVTLIQGANIRTGVTAILPHGGNLFQEKVAGAVFVGNAFGKLAGSTQVEELGTIETPIVLTNTLSVGTAVEAVVAHTLKVKGNESVRSVNALVGETNDGGLNDIRGQHVRREHIWEAIDQAREARLPRDASAPDRHGLLRLEGRDRHIVASPARAIRELPARHPGPDELRRRAHDRRGTVGKALGRYEFNPDSPRRRRAATEPEVGIRRAQRRLLHDRGGHRRPADARDLKRLAARAVFGLARTGSSYSNGSGDYAIAFTTSPELRTRSGANPATPAPHPPDRCRFPLFQAALEATGPSTTPCSRRPRRPAPAGPSRPSPSTRSARSSSDTLWDAENARPSEDHSTYASTAAAE